MLPRKAVVVRALVASAVLDNEHEGTLFPSLMLPTSACRTALVKRQSIDEYSSIGCSLTCQPHCLEDG